MRMRTVARVFGRTPQERLPRIAEALADLRATPSRSAMEQLEYPSIAHLYALDLRRVGRHGEAVSAGAEAVAAARELHAARPRVGRGVLAQCLITQATTLLADLPGSAGEIRTLTDEALTLTRLKSTSLVQLHLVSTANSARGHAELEAGDPDAAEEPLWQAVYAAKKMPRRQQVRTDQLAWLADVVRSLARCRQAKGDSAEAEWLAAKARELTEASKGVQLASKEIWAALSELNDIVRGRQTRASDAGAP